MGATEFAVLDHWFNDLVDLDEAARAAALAPLDAADPALSARVRAMLAASANSDRRLRAAIDRAIDDSAPDDPAAIGPFRVLRRLGAGGMGAVYLCQRESGDFTQLLAVKRLALAAGPGWARERLRLERRVLASLRHPHIAQLVDGGDDDAGAPYVAMEFVDGISIDRFVREHGLDRRERVTLFLDLCAAVQFAHGNLVVHRDIKPANVLVDRHGQLKLLDFGIAKLLGDGPAADAGTLPTIATAMTPQYASPEQVRGEPVAQASDIYSLGLVLYELLAERRAYAIDSTRPSEVERIICETDPPPPCAATGDRSAAGADLDCIVLRALHKEPGRRYATAAQFADDLRNWLAGKPVQARADSPGYRLSRFLRRHPVGAGMSALVLLLLTTFAAAMAWQARQLAAQRDVATREAGVARETADFLVDLFAASDPRGTDDNNPRARDLLDRAASRLPNALPTDPLARARLMHVIGLAYANLADDARGTPLLVEALRLREQYAAPDSKELVDSLSRLGNMHRIFGRYSQALPLFERALAIRERRGVIDHDLADSYNNLGLLFDNMEDYTRAEATLRHSLDIERRAGGPATPKAHAQLQNLATALQGLHRLPEAKAAALESLELKRAGKDTGAGLANTLARLADIERESGQLDDALAHSTESLALRRKSYGDRNPTLAAGLVVHANILAARGEIESAQATFEEAMAVHARSATPDGIAAARTELAYGLFLLAHGDRGRGAELLRQAHERATRALEPQSAALGAFEQAVGNTEVAPSHR